MSKAIAIETGTTLVPPPEPSLTAGEMTARAAALQSLLRARQAACETDGRISEETNAELVKAGFYRIVQPHRFGGYEFDVPTFYRVMMEIARGCPETAWVLALTAGHPLLLAAFPEQAQADAYGETGEFRCPAAFNPPARATPEPGGYRINGTLASASGIDIATHFIGMAATAGETIQFLLERDQFAIVDDWDVIGMQGTGSKTVRIDDVFVPSHRTVRTISAQRGPQAAETPRLYDNPMYAGRIQPFLIGEAAAVAVGAARGALDLYEQSLRGKRSMFPPHIERTEDPEYLRHYGEALALICTAEAALIKAGDDFMESARIQARGGPLFGDEQEHRLVLIEQQSVRLAWQAVELIFRTAGTSASAKRGAAIGRVFRNMAVITTHPALQMDRTGMAAARQRFGGGAGS